MDHASTRLNQPSQDGVSAAFEQFAGQRRAEGFGIRRRAAPLAEDQMAAVGFADQTAQPELAVVQQGMTGDGYLTAALQAGVERPFRHDRRVRQ